MEKTETEHLVKEQMGHNVWTAIRSVRIAVPAAGLSGGHSGAEWGAEARMVLDEGAGNQGQSAVEIVAQCSTEGERAPTEARRGQKQ